MNIKGLDTSRQGFVQVEREAQGLKRTTEALEGRTAALSEQLAAQRSQADQRLFAAQQETDQARDSSAFPSRVENAALMSSSQAPLFLDGYPGLCNSCLVLWCQPASAPRAIHRRQGSEGGRGPAQARRELEEAQAGRTDATEAAMKLQRLVASVQAEMTEAQAAADQCAPSANAPAQRSPVPHKARWQIIGCVAAALDQCVRSATFACANWWSRRLVPLCERREVVGLGGSSTHPASPTL